MLFQSERWPLSKASSNDPINWSAFSKDERALLDRTFNFVARDSWRIPESQFFTAVVQFISETLDVAHVLCDEIASAEPLVFRTIAAIVDREFVPNFSYDGGPSPCRNVIHGTPYIVPKDLQQLYPDYEILAEVGAQSYIGVPLMTESDEPEGLICILDRKPTDNPELYHAVLELIGTRIASEMKRREVLATLRSSERRFRDFVDISSDWYWEKDAELRYSYFSEKFDQVTGMSSAGMLGKTGYGQGLDDSDAKALKSLDEDMEMRRPFRDFIYTRPKPDGSTAYFSISGKPAYGDTGEFLGYRGIGRDISRQKLGELALAQSRDEANRANRAKSDFLASMSHELRTPLNAIQGMSEALMYIEAFRNDPNRLTDYLKSIHESCTHLVSLIDEILDIAKIEQGAYGMHAEYLMPKDLIEAVRRLMKDSAAKNESKIEIDAPSDLPRIFADRRAFHQVLLNLVANSVNHSGKGTTVWIKARAEGSNTDLIVEVSDNGCGFDPETLDMVGQPFIHAHTPHVRREASGTGLGLSIVVRLVQACGGRVEFESEPGHGAIIKTYWPTAPGSRPA